MVSKQNSSTSPSFNSKPPDEQQNFTITISDVSKRYHKQSKDTWALHKVSMQIEPGIFGLLGRNGAGKTTLLQILATLLEPTTGNIQIGPYDTRHGRWQIRHHLGFLPQELGFYPRQTVKETLRYLANLQGIKPINEEIDRVLEAVNLADRKNKYVGTLSGGMRRRLGLAQALLGDPQVLIVDEPTAGLDPLEQQRFRTLLATLGAQGRRTILLSTHIVADIATIASRVAVLEEGKRVFLGTTAELAAKALGNCWHWHTTIEQVEQARQKSLLVTSIMPATDKDAALNQVIARVIGKKPANNATAVEPTLEDGYFALIGKADL